MDKRIDFTYRINIGQNCFKKIMEKYNNLNYRNA